MLADRALPEDLTARLQALVKRWAGDSDLAAVYLFGSRARGTAGPRSDVDLAVTLDSGVDDGDRFRKRLALIGEATAALGTDAVDVVLLEDAPSSLGHRIIAAGKLLIDKHPRRRAAVAEQILRRYLDEEPIRRELDRQLSLRLREGRFAR